MDKVDVAIQSYKKPESLLYALMSLYKYNKDYVDTVYIDDDSGYTQGQLESLYNNEQIKNYFVGWKIIPRENKRHVGYWFRIVIRNSRTIQMNKEKELWYKPLGISFKRLLYCVTKSLLKHYHIFQYRSDVRYQYALDNTNKKYVYVMHDDTLINGPIIKIYLENIKKDEKFGIVGDLGQCWRCHYNNICSPEKIVSGVLPTGWPLTPKMNAGENHRACRINEWSALLNIQAVKDVLQQKKTFFGNYDDDADVAAFWMAQLLDCGYKINDPLPTKVMKNKYYVHGWNGQSGHSVWVNQGNGKTVYSAQMIKDKMIEDFGVALI